MVYFLFPRYKEKKHFYEIKKIHKITKYSFSERQKYNIRRFLADGSVRGQPSSKNNAFFNFTF